MKLHTRYQHASQALRHWRAPMPAEFLPGWHASLWREQRTLLTLITLCSALAYLAFVFADAAMYPAITRISLYIRLPATLAALGLLALAYWRVKDARQWDLLALPTTTVLALFSLYPILQYQGSVSSGYISSSLSYIAVLSLLTLTRFRWALVASFIIGSAVLWSMIQLLPSLSMALLEFFCAFMPIYVFCLLVCWNRLLASRRAYLRRLLNEYRLQTLGEANSDLRTQADTDSLTGIGNRRAFEATLRERLGRTGHDAGGFTLLLVDVDHFKQYNDHYGHDAGDECLQDIARTLHQALPGQSPAIFRIGGEEFAIVVETTVADALQMLCIRLVEAIRNLQIPHQARPDDCPHVTISVGACLVPANEVPARKLLLKQADYYLYQAKARGRNRAIIGTLG